MKILFKNKKEINVSVENADAISKQLMGGETPEFIRLFDKGSGITMLIIACDEIVAIY